MDDLVGQAREFYKANFNGGYYRYFVLMTLDDKKPLVKEHPKDAWKTMCTRMEKYFKDKITCEVYPELSNTGRLHAHGFFCFLAQGVDPEAAYRNHEYNLRLVKSWMKRIFGFNSWQRCSSYDDYYVVEDCKRFTFLKRAYTTFDKAYAYIIKEARIYPWLSPWKSINLHMKELDLRNHPQEAQPVVKPLLTILEQLVQRSEAVRRSGVRNDEERSDEE